jgi:hypothetical protein
LALAWTKYGGSSSSNMIVGSPLSRFDQEVTPGGWSGEYRSLKSSFLPSWSARAPQMPNL